MKKSDIVLLGLICALCLYIVLSTVFLMDGWGVLIHVALYIAAGAGIALGGVFFGLKKRALLKTCLVIEALVVLVLTVVIILNFTAHLNDYDTDEEKITQLIALIEGAGGWAMAVYVFVQILQVVILPLPAVVCYVPGTYIWGPGMATLLASIGVLIGALICYVLGRLCGRRIVEWIAGKEVTDKYADYLGKKGKLLFVMMQILPFFPDDILCLVAGLTKMNFPFFLVTMILVRPAIVAVYCYMGSGELIPFEGWGIGVWVAIFAVCIVLAALSFKYQDQIEGWLKRKFTFSKKSANAAPVEESGMAVEEPVSENDALEMNADNGCITDKGGGGPESGRETDDETLK